MVKLKSIPAGCVFACDYGTFMKVGGLRNNGVRAAVKLEDGKIHYFCSTMIVFPKEAEIEIRG